MQDTIYLIAVGSNNKHQTINTKPPAPTTVSRPTTPPAPSTPVATPKARPATPVSTPAPTTQYPPITLGSGPKAQVFVNKGRGYIDSKTGKPMPPSIVKAMGV